MSQYTLTVQEHETEHGTEVKGTVHAYHNPTEVWGTIRLLLTYKGAYDFTTENLVAMEADIFSCADELEIFLSKHKLQRFHLD